MLHPTLTLIYTRLQMLIKWLSSSLESVFYTFMGSQIEIQAKSDKHCLGKITGFVNIGHWDSK